MAAACNDDDIHIGTVTMSGALIGKT
jgi:hypothetical protein